jgi:hypothetical protein
MESTLFLREITKKLRRSSTSFTAPFVRRFDEPGSLKGTSEAGLVQAFTEEELIHLL